MQLRMTQGVRDGRVHSGFIHLENVLGVVCLCFPVV